MSRDWTRKREEWGAQFIVVSGEIKDWATRHLFCVEV
jgi:hypothetical protein